MIDFCVEGLCFILNNHQRQDSEKCNWSGYRARNQGTSQTELILLYGEVRSLGPVQGEKGGGRGKRKYLYNRIADASGRWAGQVSRRKSQMLHRLSVTGDWRNVIWQANQVTAE